MKLFSAFASGVMLLQTTSCLAFHPVSRDLRLQSIGTTLVLRSSNDDSGETGYTPPPPPPPSPPPVPQKRLDPLMASLTRMDPETANGPTRNIPIFGEVPVDGSLVVLVPAAVIAFLGVILSIVVAVNSSDEIVNSLSNVVDDISQTASTKTNMVYDESVCRGLCSSQSDDLEGLRKFMETLRKE